MDVEEIKIDDVVLKSIMNTVDMHIEKTYHDYIEKAMNEIENYVINHNLIIHGSYAIMALLKLRKVSEEDMNLMPKDTVVTSYYKCYTCNGRKNIAELLKLLTSLGYERIQPQVHHLNNGIKCTLSVSEFERTLTLIEMTHISVNEYKRMRKMCVKYNVKNKKPLLLIDPLFMKIQLLNKLLDPIIDFIEWKDTYKYKIIFDKYYNEYTWFNGTEKDIKKQYDIRKNKLLCVLNDILVYNINDIVFVDTFVYKLYAKLVNNKNMEANPMGILSIMSKNAEKTISKILSILKKNKKIKTKKGFIMPNINGNLLNKLTIKTYTGMMNTKVVLRCDKKILLNVYQISTQCIPYISIMYDDVSINIGNYFVVLKLLYTSLWDNYVNLKYNKGPEHYVKHLEGLIKNVMAMRETYLYENKLMGIELGEQHIFKVFNLKCLLTNDYYSDTRSHNVKLWEYRKTHTKDEYNKIKRMCEPLPIK